MLNVATEGPPRLSWHQVRDDPACLDVRRDQYLELNRLSDGEFELRFSWHPGLEAQFRAVIAGREHELKPVGVSGNQAVWHCLFQTSRPSVEVLIRGETEDFSLGYGAEGFSLIRTSLHPV